MRAWSERRAADLAIVGAGASAAHTLLALLTELSSTDFDHLRPARIIVIDRDPQFFSGVAYGRRSGRASLTLSTLHGFLPEHERDRFIAWCDRRERLGRTADPAWLARHLPHIAAGRWAELFIPRRLYGEYLESCVDAAIQDAQSEGVADVALLNAQVTSIERTDGRLLVTADDGDGHVTQIDAAAAVLAIGSPATRRLPTDGFTSDGVFHDVYDPSLDATLARLHDRLVDLPVHDRRILVVGGNASALEFVSVSRDVVRTLDARLTVLSPSGRPRNWRRRRDGEVAELPAIEALRTRVAKDQITAAELYDAVAADVRAAEAEGTDLAAVRDIVAAIPFFIGLFDEEERAALATRYGLAITNLLRQDSADAVDVLESSIESGVVDFAAGRLVNCRADDRYFNVTVRDHQGRERLLDTRFGAVVGGIGFEGVSHTRTPLIEGLLSSGLVEASSSDAGLRVDSEYRAAPGLFVVGPLLAGNAHPGWLIWHAESVRRIMAIAPAAASCIARELILAAQTDLADSVGND